MKAAVLEKLNQPLVIRDIEIPLLTSGQVLVKLAYSGVCHSQLMESKGNRGEDKYLPHLLGHEGSGVVIEIGRDVTKVKPGDKVILGWIKGSGLSVNGGQYRYNEGLINSGAVTTFNEFSVVSESRCTILPFGLPMDVAVLFGCALLTGAGVVTNMILPKPESTIALFGLGGIGMSALMATKLFNCSKIIAIDTQEEKLAVAKDLGATHFVNATLTDPVEAIREITNGKNVDYSIESAGLVKTIEQAFASIKRGGGLCVFASHPPQGQKISIEPYELICGKQLKGTWGGNSDPDKDIPIYAKLYRQGKLPLEKLFSKRYKLSQINEALNDLENRTVGRPLIEIDTNIQYEYP